MNNQLGHLWVGTHFPNFKDADSDCKYIGYAFDMGTLLWKVSKIFTTVQAMESLLSGIISLRNQHTFDQIPFITKMTGYSDLNTSTSDDKFFSFQQLSIKSM